MLLTEPWIIPIPRTKHIVHRDNDRSIIQNSANLRKKDFVMKHEDFSKNKVGQREYLNNPKTTDLTRKLYSYFETVVEIPRMKHGERQTIVTLINEEAFLLAQCLRDGLEIWSPRIVLSD